MPSGNESPARARQQRCVRAPARRSRFGRLGEVCRLGLATRGNTRLDAEDVLAAVERGVDYLNWCGHPDGMSEAVRRMGRTRREIVLAAQIAARTADDCRRELDGLLAELGTDYLDVATYYYVEHDEEWHTITSAGGAAEVLEAAREVGTVRAIGLTSHQRLLAARLADSGRLDMIMIRYNAAHRGAERDIFPITTRRGMPVTAFTGLRWGALLEPTPDDPPGFRVPDAPDWYRFVLCHPAVTVALMAPDGRAQLEQDLTLLDDWRGLDPTTFAELRAHGDRVRRHAPRFP